LVHFDGIVKTVIGLLRQHAKAIVVETVIGLLRQHAKAIAVTLAFLSLLSLRLKRTKGQRIQIKYESLTLTFNDPRPEGPRKRNVTR
jgi:hypothetical protein